jgi:membrane-associated ATPase C chain
MNYVLALMIFFVLSTIGVGIRLYIKGGKQDSLKSVIMANVALFTPLVGSSIAMMMPKIIFAAGETAANPSAGLGLGYIGAALATGMATIGAGYAVGAAGAAALGAVSEDEKILGKTLIFVGLAEGIAIYGLIVSIMILGRL